EAIVRPAAARGAAYESEALIEELVAHAEHAPGGLPLLQFTLAELWDARDVPGRMIRAVSLAALGGVAGALARHADRLLAGLSAPPRAGSCSGWSPRRARGPGGPRSSCCPTAPRATPSAPRWRR